MKVLIISQNSQLYSTSRLLQEANDLNIPISQLNIYEDGAWSAGENCPGTVVFNRYSGVLYDDFDLQLAKSWSENGSLILNPVEDCKTFRDKLSAHIFLNTLDIPTPETKAFRGPVSLERLESQLQFKKSEDTFEDEFLIKPTRGNKGHGISLCRGIDSLASQLESYFYLKDQRYIIQPRLKILREFRLFFIGDKIVASFEKHQKNLLDFRLNAERSECFKIEPESINEELNSFFHQVKRSTNLFYGGIDIAETESGFYLIEINPTPGFETLEKVCGINIAKDLLLQVQNVLSN
jgi:ribosomal protein S6--L-glutamate ligase